MVMLLAQPDGSASSAPVGTTTAQANGTWSIATQPLGDSGYTFSVSAFNPAAPSSTIRSASIGRVIISTHGPQVGRIAFDAKHGTITVTYDDSVGLTPTGLLNPAAYTLSQGSSVLHPTAVNAVAATAGSFAETMSLVFNRGRKLKPGQDILTIDSSLVRDIVGNPLNGEFTGTFPSGNGASGGNFAAAYTIKNNANRSVKGPTAVLVTVGATHPNKTKARHFAARIPSQGLTATHALARGGRRTLNASGPRSIGPRSSA
jgi:hypothetical protein